ncbi:MAG: hypothetical protein KC620_17370 [Myxococcales bacterium]|nr:hypothetical protein [Myxococcales bacterium]
MNRSVCMSLLAALSVAACGDDVEPLRAGEVAEPPAPSSPGIIEEPPVEEMPDEPETIEPTGPQTYVSVARTLKFARIDETGRSWGFDLDARVSTASDREACYQEDFRSPMGDEGVDNQFARLLPLIEAAGGAALEGLVQSAINEGDLLVMMEISGVDDWQNDGDVQVTLYRGTGLPYVGTDGYVEAWQTFDIDPEAPWSRVEHVALHDGVLEAGPFALTLPIYVFDFVFYITVGDARLHIEFDERGPHSAMMGGAIALQNILDIANNIDGGQQIPGVVENLGRTFADLDRDDEGHCQALSVALRANLAGAFFYDDTERPTGAE